MRHGYTGRAPLLRPASVHLAHLCPHVVAAALRGADGHRARRGRRCRSTHGSVVGRARGWASDSWLCSSSRDAPWRSGVLPVRASEAPASGPLVGLTDSSDSQPPALAADAARAAHPQRQRRAHPRAHPRRVDGMGEVCSQHSSRCRPLTHRHPRSLGCDGAGGRRSSTRSPTQRFMARRRGATGRPLMERSSSRRPSSGTAEELGHHAH